MMYGRPSFKMFKFNIEEQRKFFRRKDVRRHFLEEMPKEIQKRMSKNNEIVNKFTGHIKEILEIENNNQLARNLIDKHLRSSHYPWSIEMFEDIKIFSLSVFRDYVYTE